MIKADAPTNTPSFPCIAKLVRVRVVFKWGSVKSQGGREGAWPFTWRRRTMAHAPPRRSLSIFAHLSSGMTDRDTEIWVNPTSAKMQNGMQPPSPIDLLARLGNMRVAYRVDGSKVGLLLLGFEENLSNVQSIPIQCLQGFRPSICFLACKSKISLISLWAQFKTRRDRNLVNVEWELTVKTKMIFISLSLH